MLYTKLSNKVVLYLYLMHTIYCNIQAHELFVDTTKLPLVKKKIKKLEAQESNESRRLAMIVIHCIVKYRIANKFGELSVIVKLNPSNNYLFTFRLNLSLFLAKCS